MHNAQPAMAVMQMVERRMNRSLCCFELDIVLTHTAQGDHEQDRHFARWHCNPPLLKLLRAAKERRQEEVEQ